MLRLQRFETLIFAKYESSTVWSKSYLQLGKLRFKFYAD